MAMERAESNVGYWHRVFFDAWFDTWEIVIEHSVLSLLVLGVIAVLVIYNKHEKPEAHLKKWIVDLLHGIRATAIVFAVIYVFHVCFVTPRKLYKELSKTTMPSKLNIVKWLLPEIDQDHPYIITVIRLIELLTDERV